MIGDGVFAVGLNASPSMAVEHPHQAEGTQHLSFAKSLPCCMNLVRFRGVGEEGRNDRRDSPPVRLRPRQARDGKGKAMNRTRSRGWMLAATPLFLTGAINLIQGSLPCS